MRILTLLLILLWPAWLWAEYTPSELFVVEWGEDSNEFTAYEAHEVDPGTPEDTTDDYYDGGSGPMKAFVDENSNFILVSPSHHQVKGFRDGGSLLFDISGDSPDFRRGMYRGNIIDIFVDGESQIYLSTLWPMPYVPVINYIAMTVDSLRPFVENPEEPIYAMNWTYDGKLMFRSKTIGWITFNGVESVAGGSFAVMSADGFFRVARLIPPDTARFYFFEDPDTSGSNPNDDSTDVLLGVEELVHIELLNSMEPTHLYLMVGYYTDYSFYEVWQFDLEYNLIDKVIPPAEPQYYSSTPKPFITENGDIYEFRCLEDGLHVIRWSKE